MKVKETCSKCGSKFEASTSTGLEAMNNAFWNDGDEEVNAIERQLEKWRKEHKCKS